jgi:formate-dependent nitrite reductase membrane component NrfD
MDGYIRQGELDFSVNYKLQQTWGLQEAAIFFLEGVGVTLAASFMWLNNSIGMILGLAVLTVGVILLFFHLGHPEKFWRAFTMMRGSWISRGTALITAFFLLSLIYLTLKHIGMIEEGNLKGMTLKTILLIIAFFIIAYPGLLLSRSPSISFWNSGLLPFIFTLQGMSSGFSIVIVFLSAKGKLFSPVLAFNFFWAHVGLLCILFISIVFYLTVMTHAGAAARESARMLIKGELMRPFISLGLVLGILVPLVLTVYTGIKGGHFSTFLFIAAMAKNVGDIYFRHFVIKAGMYDRVF